MRIGWSLLLACAGLALPCNAALAQLVPAPSLPPLGGVVDGVGRTANDLVGDARGVADNAADTARGLADARVERLETLVRRHPDRLEMTDVGPAVRGEIIAIDPDPATLAALGAAGFVRRGGESTDALGLAAVSFGVPNGWSVDRALSRLRRIAPGATFAANVLYEPSGAASLADLGHAGQGAGGGAVAPIGIVDGGVAAHPALRGPIRQQGFVQGAPRSSTHGTAVASLIAGQGMVRGAAPGAPLLVADIYGADPAGGNALALVRALAWLAGQRTRVVAMSLAGPANALVQRAVAAAQARGMYIVAAVGNDGRAAPPTYPASYPGVIAVTGVDGRGRVLIEAGRALHLDYAAPAADMAAAGGRGLVAVRGTSYAVPFVAGRLAQHIGSRNPLAALDAEARRGRGVGRGVICAECRTVLPAR
ncbi:S8 family serine peptidase [Sphingosinicella sp.]|uniref:S8 family serine peptidase n=1 Tax=Sphingosinicella sp. TaxID=1917971 RepID=UPI00403773BC